jgi:AbrB family looped-hinge helix DNA binding protein
VLYFRYSKGKERYHDTNIIHATPANCISRHRGIDAIIHVKGLVKMRATGIIRRVDDLGRVVIPKEIRRTLRIREGEPLEIYTDGDNTVCFRKYQTNMVNEVRTMGEVILDDFMYDIACDGTAEQAKMFSEAREHFKALRELVGKFEKSIENEEE